MHPLRWTQRNLRLRGSASHLVGYASEDCTPADLRTDVDADADAQTVGGGRFPPLLRTVAAISKSRNDSRLGKHVYLPRLFEKIPPCGCLIPPAWYTLTSVGLIVVLLIAGRSSAEVRGANPIAMKWLGV